MSEKQGNPPRIGVYICHCGGNISDHVDVEKVRAQAESLPGVALARSNSFMCSDPGQELIMDDLTQGRIDRVVVASCAPSLHETTFRGAIARAGCNPYLYEHANIREQVSWVHHGDQATEKAACLVAAAAAKAGKLQSLESIKVEATEHATVIGGGVAGMRAALDMAGRGLRVTLIERTPFLGGNVAQLDRVFPSGEKAVGLLEALAARVLDSPAISLLTCAEVKGQTGYVGNFTLQVRQSPPQGEDLERLSRLGDPGPGCTPFVGVYPAAAPRAETTLELRTGAVVFATGFEHYQPPKGEYGYGDSPHVVTLPELIKIMASAQPGKPLEIGGRPVASAAFIHCVGSRQIPGVHEPGPDGKLAEYCSRVCCTASLQAARELREIDPELVIYDLYRDIRTYGRGQEEYYLGASRDGVLFVRYAATDPPRVEPADDDESALKISVADQLMAGRELEIPVDLVVLAVGMRPGPVQELGDLMKLPQGADGFLLEVHPKLRPVELASAGLLLAGTCQAPMDSGEASAAAGAAAAKASGLLIRGQVELDPFVAVVDAQACDGCGDCVEACLAEDAITVPEGGPAQINPALCLGCGVCVAACPHAAIQVQGWTLPQFEAMVDAIARHGKES